MAGSPAGETAVGQESMDVHVWRPIAPEQWTTIEPALLEKLGAAAAEHMFEHEIRTEIAGKHSVVHIPVSAIHEGAGERPNLIDYADTIAGALGRRQIRFGARASSYFVGFSGQLSDDEAQLCRDLGLWQLEAGKYLPALSANQADGSQTLRYNRGIYAASKAKLSRLQQLHGLVLKRVAPHLEGGAVVAPIIVPVQRPDYPSLFTSEQT